LNEIDLVAAANRPGLIGALLVGVSAGKGIAWSMEKPFIAINHIEAHLYSPHLDNQIDFPYIGLLASGGHTMIVLARSFTEYDVLGTTIDDAVGEAFDKIAKFYELGYPGGPAVEKLSLEGDEKAFDFPVSNLYKSERKFDVSYSGLKTAVIHYQEKYRKKENYTVADIAASFQKKAFQILIKKTISACEKYKIKTIVVAGGVASNNCLKSMFEKNKDYKIYFPSLKYATDNGAMIAGFAFHKYLKEGKSDLSCGVYPRVSGYKISLEK
jgi:N6-L-threonylcarbamoyladenine synthase